MISRNFWYARHDSNVRPTESESVRSIQLSYERIYEINGGTPVIAF